MEETHSWGIRGVWTPIALFTDKDLSPSEKNLVVVIDLLDNDDRHCFATNTYLAEEIGKSVSTVANNLTRLRDTGWIWEVDLGDGRRHLTTKLKEQRIVKPVLKNEKAGSQKREGAVLKNENDIEKNLRTKENKKEEEETSPHALKNPPDPKREVVAPGWEWPMKELIEAFPDFLPSRLQPNMIGFIEGEVKPGDEIAWSSTIEHYKMNFNPVTNSYMPDKVGNLLRVFRSRKAELEKGRGGNGNKPTERIVFDDFDGYCPSCSNGFQAECPMHGDKKK